MARAHTHTTGNSHTAATLPTVSAARSSHPLGTEGWQQPRGAAARENYLPTFSILREKKQKSTCAGCYLHQLCQRVKWVIYCLVGSYVWALGVLREPRWPGTVWTASWASSTGFKQKPSRQVKSRSPTSRESSNLENTWHCGLNRLPGCFCTISC